MKRDQRDTTILVNGNVLTMDDQSYVERPTAIVVSGGTIEYVGDDDSARGWQDTTSELVDLEGMTVLPGFVESHAHPSVYGTNLLGLDCRPELAASRNAIQEIVSDAARNANANSWIIGWGWDESYFPDGKPPTRADLDLVAPNNPVLLRRTCGHMAVVNSAALAASGVDEDMPDPEGGRLVRDQEGRLTGLIQEKAQGLVQPTEYDEEEVLRGLELAQAKYASWGVTTIHDMSARGIDMRVYQRLLSTGSLSMRLRPWLWAIQANYRDGVLEEALKTGIASGFGNDFLRIQGVKFMLDGGIGGRTAAVAEPFEDSHDHGILSLGLDEAAPWVAKALAGGLRVAIHGIGERAIDVAIQSYVLAAEQLGIEKITSMRNRIEHCALPTEGNLDDMKRLSLIAASSVGFLYALGDSYMANLGAERMKRVYPQKSFQEHGIVAPGNSDSPVTEGNPWLGIYAAVNRTSASGQVLDDVQNISIDAALRSYTRDAAYASFEEDRLGVIRVGAFGDLNVVSADPFVIGPENLHKICTVHTFVGGRKVYSAR